MSVEEGDRRSEILSAAFEEFAAKGYKGATIKSIAAEARLNSPALIYWYFPDKEALFREVLESRAPVLRTVAGADSLMELPPEEALAELGRAFLAFGRVENRRLIQFILGESLRRPEVAEIVAERGPARVVGFLESYLDRQVESGRLRPHDTRSGAKAYLGMLIPQIAGNVVFPVLAQDELTDEEHLKTATEIFLAGLSPEIPTTR